MNTQVNFSLQKTKWMELVSVATELSAMEVRVAMVIASHLNRKTGETFVGRETIAEEMGGVSVKSISRAIKKLELKYLGVRRQRGRTNWNFYSLKFPEKETSVSPFISDEKGTLDNHKGDIQGIKTGHPCPPNLDTNLKEVTLGNAKRFPTQPVVFKNRGLYEGQLASMLGPNGWDILSDLDDRQINRLCRRKAQGRLTFEELSVAVDRFFLAKAKKTGSAA